MLAPIRPSPIIPISMLRASYAYATARDVVSAVAMSVVHILSTASAAVQRELKKSFNVLAYDSGPTMILELPGIVAAISIACSTPGCSG